VDPTILETKKFHHIKGMNKSKRIRQKKRRGRKGKRKEVPILKLPGAR
jgi:hypothetical protein